MARNLYEILGVAPTSEDVVIRAAYRALMRRYHPDADPLSDTSERAREINAAYAVLNDPDKRARYDGSLAAAGLIKANPEPRLVMTMPSLPRPSPAVLAGLAAFAGLVALIAIAPPLPQMPGAPAILGDVAGKRSPIGDASPAAKPPSALANARACDEQATHDSIKAAAFRRAAQLGGRDAQAFGAVAEGSLVRIQAEPAAASGGKVRCDGWLALDLPPGVVVDGNRSNLNSEVHYAVAGAPGGQVRLADLTGLEALIGSLATLARAPQEPELPMAEPPEPAPAPEVLPAPPRRLRESAPAPPPAIPKPVAAKAARPAKRAVVVNQASFSCRHAKSRTEKAICGSSNLAALDRHLALFYSQSLGRADAGRRDALTSSDGKFASRRDSCRSEKCLTAAYVTRMREVSEIMARQGQP